ncbi:hypothetical protein Tco_0759618 [Tanacetum coccineum]
MVKECEKIIHEEDIWKEGVYHGMEYMETKEAVDEGRQSSEIKEVKLTDDTEVVEDKGSGDKGENAKELVSTARPEVSTARPDIDAARQEDSVVEPRTPPTTTSIFDDEDITMAQTLIKMKEEKSKEKGVSIKDVDDSSRPTRSILTLKPLPTIDPKDKGKSVLEEPEPTKKMTRSDFDAAQIARDAEIARQLQEDLQAEEETEEYTIKERAKFLAETIDTQRKFRAAQRSAEIRKEEFIKKMNEKETDKDTSNKEKVLEEPDNTKVEVKQEGHGDSTRKRLGKRLKMKATKKSKRQKTDSDLEEEEQLKAFLMIVPDEEEIINYEVLEKRFDRLDLEELYNLKMNSGRIKKDGILKARICMKIVVFIPWLVVGTASEDAYTLLRFIQKQIDEFGGQDGREDCWVLEDFTTYCYWFNIGAASEDLVLLRKIKENRLSVNAKSVLPGVVEVNAASFVRVGNRSAFGSRMELEMITSQLQGKLWLYDEVLDWSISSLSKNIKSNPVYHTPLDDPLIVRDAIFNERPSPKRNTKKWKTIFHDPFQMELSEMNLGFRKWETILSENVISFTGNKDHPNACLVYMLFCLVNRTPFNLAYDMVKMIANVVKNDVSSLPYGMLLTRLYRHVQTIQPCPVTDAHFLTDHVMVPLTEGRVKRFMVDGKRPHPQTSSSSSST